MAVLLETSLGDITIDLFTKERPKCCMNFLKLCKIKYYNFCLFHSVQRNLVAQTGDPTGSGRGGNSIYAKLYGDQARYFDMETHPRIKHKAKGLVSMVNNGNNMNGSQFFFTLEDSLDYLDGVHTVFGEVAEGEDTLSKINEAYCDSEHRPYKDIRIYHTIILDDPFDDPADLPIPDRSPEPTAQQLDSGRIGAEEDIDDTKGMAAQEVHEMLSEKEARANAQLLEMVGDLPSADVKPEDNVLFVCKLNPVTSSDDLEIIFSRFGNISSCEVIKDQKSGESLQYAFIEFEKPEDCESAYFKMDNVLIDDRRIHVDFSQSVSKVKWRGKGKGVDHMTEKGKAEAPEYVLKNKPRQDGGKYSLLFDDHDLARSQSHKKKKSHKKHKHSSSNEDSDSEQRKKKRKHKSRGERSDSASPLRLAVKERRRRSRSRSYEKRDRYSDTRHDGEYHERRKEDAHYRRGSDRSRSDRR